MNIPDGWKRALEDIALLDEADGHELTRDHAHRAVAIACKALGKHPSQIFHERHAASPSPPESKSVGGKECKNWAGQCSRPDTCEVCSSREAALEEVLNLCEIHFVVEAAKGVNNTYGEYGATVISSLREEIRSLASTPPKPDKEPV